MAAIRERHCQSYLCAPSAPKSRQSTVDGSTIRRSLTASITLLAIRSRRVAHRLTKPGSARRLLLIHLAMRGERHECRTRVNPMPSRRRTPRLATRSCATGSQSSSIDFATASRDVSAESLSPDRGAGGTTDHPSGVVLDMLGRCRRRCDTRSRRSEVPARGSSRARPADTPICSARKSRPDRLTRGEY
jgi:hypothetical protein